MTTIWNRQKILSDSYVAYANAGKFKGKNCKSLEKQSKNVFPSILIQAQMNLPSLLLLHLKTI